VSTQAPARPRRGGLVGTTIGRKAVMAVSGFLMLAFLIVHMLGNLKFFLGAADFDHYAAWLRTIGEPLLPHGWYLWIQRGVLIVVVAAHFVSAYLLTRQGGRARPVKYQHRPYRSSYAAHTMRWGGVVILLFVIYHILDLSTLTLNPAGVPGQVYGNVAADFSHWYVTAAYVVAMIALGIHVDHGFWSAAHTLGVHRERSERIYKTIAHVLAIALTVGFVSVPILVQIGVAG